MRMMIPVSFLVSDVCQINEVDHLDNLSRGFFYVSDVCQINEVDHRDGSMITL